MVWTHNPAALLGISALKVPEPNRGRSIRKLHGYRHPGYILTSGATMLQRALIHRPATTRLYPTVSFAVPVILMKLLVDIAHGLLDPRIKN